MAGSAGGRLSLTVVRDGENLDFEIELMGSDLFE